ncbi:NAD-dependent malic enzyme [Raoultella terrigena]|uniref:NAD-dependent malic enzyme n=1 Tax=Raoultella terrigena TaxID=577 RepID=A0A4U9CVK4_RAOTE|nr:NAD-dependent malic enzyme [Raoultella terrigena]
MTDTLPIVYTPTVGEACEHFSEIYRRARGLFISWPDRHQIDEMLQSFSRNDIRVIVVTDGERILGLGDQGVGGMGIPIGKLSLYTACGGIHPASTLPIMLDVGTNNAQLIDNPLYMGWRHPRIDDDSYLEFMDMFIEAVKRRWPDVLLQFEDFAQKNATRLLQRYRDRLCCFNDDIQGTAAVTTGTLIAAAQAAGSRLCDQRVVFLGSGSAGCGIAEKIVAMMVDDGLSEHEARGRVFMVDRCGLLTTRSPRCSISSKSWSPPDTALPTGRSAPAPSRCSTLCAMRIPTVLIGVSGQPGLFSEEIVKEMHRHCARPIIMPLSNPTSRAEAQPADLIAWTEGAALVATGSPLPRWFTRVKPTISPNAITLYLPRPRARRAGRQGRADNGKDAHRRKPHPGRSLPAGSGGKRRAAAAGGGDRDDIARHCPGYREGRPAGGRGAAASAKNSCLPASNKPTGRRATPPINAHRSEKTGPAGNVISGRQIASRP